MDFQSKKGLNKKQTVSFVLEASFIAAVHTFIGSAAFIAAFCLGCVLHFKRIVKNDVAGYPDEWFPSVSATIGDWYPERNIFQLLIAIASGPRFALIIFQYLLDRKHRLGFPTVVLVSGLIRTILCGGWVFITSSDDHDVHDICMVLYIVMNIPWMLGGISCMPRDSIGIRKKKIYVASAFFTSIGPLVYFFIQHKVHRIPGAYTKYAFFEWGLIVLDILFDYISKITFDMAGLTLTIQDQSIKAEETSKELFSKDTVNANQELKDFFLNAKAIAAQATSPPNEDVTSKMEPILNEFASFMADVYLSYVFWSIYTALIPALFYFSVWELGIAGQELALLSVLSPVLLSVKPFYSWAKTKNGAVVLNLLSFIGLLAFALDSPFHRLLVVTFATAAVALRQAVDWSSDRANMGYQGLVTGLGLLVSSVSKLINHSVNPIWPMVNSSSGGFNKLGIFLGLLSVYELLNRPETGQKKNENRVVFGNTYQSWITSSLPLGGLIFSLHSLLTDSGTLIAWGWTGYENGVPKGPLPHLHGFAIIIAQVLGLTLSILPDSFHPLSSRVTESPLWLAYGAGSFFALHYLKDWPSFIGAFNLAVFFTSVTPLIIKQAAASRRVGRTYFLAWVTACLLNLASIWTVAYAFVPGGKFLRERTDLVIIAQILTLAPAFCKGVKKDVLVTRLPKSTGFFSWILMASTIILALFGTISNLPKGPIKPHRSASRIVTAGIWTLHFGFDNTGRDSQFRVLSVLKDLEIDVVGFLESDLHRPVFGSRDLTRAAVESLGYYVDIGPGPNQHTWGAALLSKFPIISSKHHLLPSPNGELAPAIEAVLDMYGTEVMVIVSHNGQEEDPLDRELQSTELARIMASSYPMPVIFLGYVVTTPKANRPNPYEILVTDGKVHDIDGDDWDRWCEYILYRGLYRTAYARLSRGYVTDTELQIGQFVVPRHGAGTINETEAARYLRSGKEDLPQAHWMSMDYYGEGKNGHFWHVFDTPLYYRLPDGAML